MTKEKKIDLENGFELVVGGDYKRGLDCSQTLLEQWGLKSDYVYIKIRKQK